MKRRSRLEEWRESLRLQQSYNTISRYAVDFVLDRGVIGMTRRLFLSLLYGVEQPGAPYALPLKVRLMLQELGPIYVKVGQLVSSQAQALPPEWADELRQLQANVRPFPYEQVQEIVTGELGAPPEEIFAEFSPTALAAASLGQVHRARLHTGEAVVVKVQRPNIRNQVKADVGIMDWLARLAERRILWAHEVGLVGVVNEFGRQVLTELDYRVEAYNAVRLDHNLQEIPGVRLPVFYDAYSTQRVLTMEFIDGIRIDDLAALDAAGYDKRELAMNAMRATMKQILIDGFFHGDLHPGNVLVNRTDGTIVYLDTGMVGELTVQERANLVNLLMVLQQADVRGLAQSIRTLSVPFREVDEKAYRRAFERRVDRLLRRPGTPVSDIINEVLDVLRDQGLQMDPNLTLAIKSIMQMETVSRQLLPEGGFVELGVSMTLELAQQQLTPEKVTEMVKKEAVYTLREISQHLPTLQEATLGWLKQYEKGRFELYHDTSGLDPQLEKSGRLIRQLVIGILLAGIIIGSAIATGIAAAFELTESALFATIAFIGYITATLGAGLMILALLWNLWGRK